ncbi:MAG: hypothetical protein WCR52_23245 [Bacteroidota bacterium]
MAAGAPGRWYPFVSSIIFKNHFFTMQQFKRSAFFFFCLLAFAQNVHAQATLSIQGVLQKFNGSAVDDGEYDITFKLYTTDAGGTALWSETQTVPVTGGVYGVLLGAVNPLTVPFDQPYYVGLTIPGGPEHTPRTRLTAAPYALSVQGQDNKFPSTGLVQMGSMATGTDITTATSYTVGANDHVIYLDHTANQNVTLPAASAANTGRQLLLVNKEAVAKTLTSSNYVDVITGATSTTIPANSVIELQSDGSVWRQTGGYVKSAVQTKAFVRCTTNAMANLPSFNGNFGTIPHTVSYTEISDPQNNFSNNTFTAPRTGVYLFTGSLVAYDPNNNYATSYIRGSIGATGNASGISYDNINSSIPNSISVGHNFSFVRSLTAGQSISIIFERTSFAGYMNINQGGPLTITEL